MTNRMFRGRRAASRRPSRVKPTAASGYDDAARIDDTNRQFEANREAIEANRRAIEANRQAIEANREAIEANRIGGASTSGSKRCRP